MATSGSQPTNHYLQSEQWALAHNGSVWKVKLIEVGPVTVRAYYRMSPLGTIVHLLGYQPAPADIARLTVIVRQHFPKAMVCKLETCAPADEKLAQSLEANGWLKARPSQYAFTVQLDLTKSVDTLHAELKKRARNELNRAENNHVEVVEMPPTDEQLEMMYHMLTQTADRKSFGIHDKQFIFSFWQTMREASKLCLFLAKHESQTLAAAVVVLSDDGKQAWYKEGASAPNQPAFNAPRYLLWEIALRLKQSGVELFDLSGVPDPATYDASSMQGIFIFKTAYTNTVTRMMPAYELPINPTKYRLWPKVELAVRKLAQKRHSNWY